MQSQKFLLVSKWLNAKNVWSQFQQYERNFQKTVIAFLGIPPTPGKKIKTIYVPKDESVKDVHILRFREGYTLCLNIGSVAFIYPTLVAYGHSCCVTKKATSPQFRQRVYPPLNLRPCVSVPNSSQIGKDTYETSIHWSKEKITI